MISDQVDLLVVRSLQLINDIPLAVYIRKASHSDQMGINIAVSVLLLGYNLKRIKCDLLQTWLQTTVPKNHFE